MAAHHLDVGADRGERGAQLVGGVGDEALLLLEQLLELVVGGLDPIEGVVEGGGQLPDLVLLGALGKAAAEVAGPTDALHRAGEHGERTQPAPGGEPGAAAGDEQAGDAGDEQDLHQRAQGGVDVLERGADGERVDRHRPAGGGDGDRRLQPHQGEAVVLAAALEGDDPHRGPRRPVPGGGGDAEPGRGVFGEVLVRAPLHRVADAEAAGGGRRAADRGDAPDRREQRRRRQPGEGVLGQLGAPGHPLVEVAAQPGADDDEEDAGDHHHHQRHHRAGEHGDPQPQRHQASSSRRRT